jgi:hypothetical protein
MAGAFCATARSRPAKPGWDKILGTPPQGITMSREGDGKPGAKLHQKHG